MNVTRSCIVAAAGFALLGASGVAAPALTSATIKAGPTGVATLPHDGRIFVIAIPDHARSGAGSDDRGGSLTVYDGRDLHELANIAICSLPDSIIANRLTERFVIGCDDNKLAIVDARTLTLVSTLSGVDARTLKAGERDSPYVYAQTDSGVVQIDTRAGIIARTIASAEISELFDFSISSEAPEQVTLYGDDRSVTIDATGGGKADDADRRRFGRLRFPDANLSIDGAHIFALGGAGSLARVEANGAVQRTPVCDTPLDVLRDVSLRRLFTICSPQDGARVEFVTTKEDGSDRKAISFATTRDSLLKKPRFVRDSVSGRFAIVKTNAIHVIDPVSVSDVYSVTIPSDITGLAIDDTGSVFATYIAGDGGGVVCFNIRNGKPATLPLRGGADSEISVMTYSSANAVAPPPRLDPPGIRSPAQLAMLADGSLLVRELLSPKIGRLRNGTYTQEDALAGSATDLIRGFDGNLWMLKLPEATGSRIARREPAGRITEFPVGAEVPKEVVASKDGLYWLIGAVDSATVGHLTYEGTLSVLHFAMPQSREGLNLVSGFAGDAAGGFFVSSNDGIGHFDAAGKLTKTIALPLDFLDGPAHLSSLEDGRLALSYARKLLIIESSGREHIYFPALGLAPHDVEPATESQELVAPPFLPSGPTCNLTDLSLGPRSSIWGICHNTIVDIEVDGKVRRYELPYAQSSPGSLVRAADDAMWFAETTQSRVGYITASGELHEIDI